MNRTLQTLIWITALAAGIRAGVDGRSARAADRPEPTVSNFRYGPHERNVFDFWQAQSSQPTPVVVYIHGGGFRRGSKESLNARTLQQLLEAGISVAACNYRFVEHSPLPAAHHDCRRALQVLRSQADEWNIDRSRIGAFGGSAGAQLSMYLAFHDDMAQPDSDDPVERQLTRLTCVATNGGQTSMDVEWWLANIPGYDAPHRDFYESLGASDRASYLAVVSDISALSLISGDDPPIFMSYEMSPVDAVPEGEKAQGWKVHHVQFGLALQEKMDALGLASHLVYPGHDDPQYAGFAEFLQAILAGEVKTPAK